jgi:hypothetical protein
VSPRYWLLFWRGTQALPLRHLVFRTRRPFVGCSKGGYGSIASLGRRSAASGLPRQTDILRVRRHVSKVPRGDIIRLAKLMSVE